MAKRYIADKFEGGEFLGINAATITTAVSITNATLTDGGYSQAGKVLVWILDKFDKNHAKKSINNTVS